MNKSSSAHDVSSPSTIVNLLSAARLSELFSRLLARRHGGMWLFFEVFVSVAFVTSLALLMQSIREVQFDSSFVATFASLPLTLILTVLPAQKFTYRWARAGGHLVFAAILYALPFCAVNRGACSCSTGAPAQLNGNSVGVQFAFIRREHAGHIQLPQLAS